MQQSSRIIFPLALINIPHPPPHDCIPKGRFPESGTRCVTITWRKLRWRTPMYLRGDIVTIPMIRPFEEHENSSTIGSSPYRPPVYKLNRGWGSRPNISALWHRTLLFSGILRFSCCISGQESCLKKCNPKNPSRFFVKLYYTMFSYRDVKVQNCCRHLYIVTICVGFPKHPRSALTPTQLLLRGRLMAAFERRSPVKGKATADDDDDDDDHNYYNDA